VASHYFALDDAYTPLLLARLLCDKQDHPQPNQQYAAPPQAQIPTYVAFTNPVVPPPVHFQRASQYKQGTNTSTA
jgi:hypothetical protein